MEGLGAGRGISVGEILSLKLIEILLSGATTTTGSFFLYQISKFNTEK